MATLREVKKRIRIVKSFMMISMVILAVVPLFASTVLGFDGNRRGFVLGGGAGYSPVAQWTYDRTVGFGASDETGGGIGLNAILGCGLDDLNIIAFESNITGWNSSAFGHKVLQGFNGASFYHYFSRSKDPAFVTLGLGGYLFDVHANSTGSLGIGALLGGGVEVARHWQVGCYFMFGNSAYEKVDFNHYQLNFLVSGIAY